MVVFNWNTNWHTHNAVSPRHSMPNQMTEIDIKALTVANITFPQGEPGIVSFAKMKKTLNKLIDRHNKVVNLLAEYRFSHTFDTQQSTPIYFDESKRFTHEDWKQLINRVGKKNKVADVIGWLFAIRYLCLCVGPYPINNWCQICNRPIQPED